jgi:3-oxoacyl-[acyl-carrier protein] reductase
VLQRHGRIDVLVNNAGIARDQLMLRMKREDWDQVIATNLTTGIRPRAGGAQADDQAARRAGSSASVRWSARRANAGQANYAASKAGLIGFSKALAREVASRNITVNVVAPGLNRDRLTKAITDKAQGDWAAQIPLGRLGTTADVAAAVCFLASMRRRILQGRCLPSTAA